MRTSITPLFYILLISVFFSCGKKKDEEVKIPAGILEADVMVKLLADFALAEGASNMNVKNSHIQTMDSIYAFNPLKEHNIRQSQYDSSLSFYVTQPEMYKKIYEDVLVVLSEMQAKRNTTVKDSTSK